MSLIMVGAEKGGVGKSTLTQNLASIRASLKFRVAVFDLDAQASMTKWDVRRRAVPALAQVHVERMPDGAHTWREFVLQLEHLRKSYDDVFIDVGGADTPIFRAALDAVDVVVMPLIPSMTDLDTVPDLAEIINGFTKRIDIRVILNQADPRKLMTKSMVTEMEGFSDVLPLMRKNEEKFLMVQARESYKFANAQGRGVAELEGKFWNADAAVEMKDLYLEVFGK